MFHKKEPQLENDLVRGSAYQGLESLTSMQLKKEAVPIQRVASGKTNTEELQSDKDEHSKNNVESNLMASYTNVPPDDDGSNGQLSIQGKFQAPNPLSFSIPKTVQRSEKAPPLQFETNPIQKSGPDVVGNQPSSTVAAYMAGEMSRNVVSGNVRRIRNLLNSTDESSIPFYNPTPGVNQARAYMEFAQLVRTGSVWDHKPYIESHFGRYSDDIPSNSSYFYDIWSNIHYGYIGLACGFGETELLQAPGGQQIVDIIRRQDFGRISEGLERGMSEGLAGFDDPLDQSAIRLGFIIYRSARGSVTPELLMSYIRALRPMLSHEPLHSTTQGHTPSTTPTAQPKLSSENQIVQKENPIQTKSSSLNTLPQPVQNQMENALGADFSDVKIHTNSSSATEVGALAYTQGTDVHFAPGQYNPESSSGQELIGHELTHVVQQREGRVQPTTQAAGLPVNDDKGLEAEADEGGRKVVQGKFGGEGKLVQKQKSDNGVIQRTIDESTQNRIFETFIGEERRVEGGRGTGTRDREYIESRTIRVLNENTVTRIIRENFPDIKTDQNFQRQFQIRFHSNVLDFIKNRFQNPLYKVRATAAYHDGSYNTPHAEMAEILLLPGVAESRFWQLMNRLTFEQRRRMLSDYNRVFSQIGLGSGDLLGDIRGNFSESEFTRINLYFQHDYQEQGTHIGDIDNVYIAIIEGNHERVTTIIRRKWGYGYDTFERFANSWIIRTEGSLLNGSDRYIVQFFPEQYLPNAEEKMRTITNNAKSFMFSILNNATSYIGLSSSVASLRNIFVQFVEENYRRREEARHSLTESQQTTITEATSEYSRTSTEHRRPSQTDGWGFTGEEMAQLNAARLDLAHATDGFGTYDEELYRAVRIIGEIYRHRIERLRRLHQQDSSIISQNNLDEAINDWQHEESRITDSRIRNETETQYETDRARLSLHGMSNGDRLYLRNGDQNGLRQLILQLYGSDNIVSAIEELNHGVYIENRQGMVPLQIRRGMTFRDLLQQTYTDHPLLGLGTGTIEAGSSYLESCTRHRDLSLIRQFLLNSGLSEEKRRQILVRFLNVVPNGLTPEFCFYQYLCNTLNYQEHEIRDFRNEFESNLRSQSARIDLEHDQNIFSDISDSITGNQTSISAEVHTRRVELLSGLTYDPDEVALMEEYFGTEASQLVSIEFRLQQNALQEIRQARTQIASVTRGIVTTVISAVCSATPLGPVGGALAGEIAGILLNELMDGEQHNAISEENLERIVVAIATAGVSQYFEEGARSASLIRNYNNPYIRGAIREGVQAAFTSGATILMRGVSGQLSLQQIANEVERAVASAITGGLLERFGIPANDQNFRRALLREVTNNVAQNVTRTSTSIGHNLVVNGRLDQDALTRIIEAAAEGLRDGILEHSGEHFGESVRDRIRSQRGSGVNQDAIVLPTTINQEPAALTSSQRTRRRRERARREEISHSERIRREEQSRIDRARHYERIRRRR